MWNKYREMSYQELQDALGTCTKSEKWRIQREMERRKRRVRIQHVDWLGIAELVLVVLVVVVAILYRVAIVSFLSRM